MYSRCARNLIVTLVKIVFGSFWGHAVFMNEVSVS